MRTQGHEDTGTYGHVAIGTRGHGDTGDTGIRGHVGYFSSLGDGVQNKPLVCSYYNIEIRETLLDAKQKL